MLFNELLPTACTLRISGRTTALRAITTLKLSQDWVRRRLYSIDQTNHFTFLGFDSLNIVCSDFQIAMCAKLHFQFPESLNNCSYRKLLKCKIGLTVEKRFKGNMLQRSPSGEFRRHLNRFLFQMQILSFNITMFGLKTTSVKQLFE